MINQEHSFRRHVNTMRFFFFVSFSSKTYGIRWPVLNVEFLSVDEQDPIKEDSVYLKAMRMKVFRKIQRKVNKREHKFVSEVHSSDFRCDNMYVDVL